MQPRVASKVSHFTIFEQGVNSYHTAALSTHLVAWFQLREKRDMLGTSTVVWEIFTVKKFSAMSLTTKN